MDSSNDAGKRYVLDIANTLNEATFDKPGTGDKTQISAMEAIPTSAVLKKVASLLAKPITTFC